MTQEEYRQSCMDVVYLASCAVKGKTPDGDRVAGMDLKKLYTAAERHLLTGITAMSLEGAEVKDDAFTQAKGKAIRKVATFDVERAAVLAGLEEAGIWYMPLKGSVLKDCYPRIGMRQMADNDILFDAARAGDLRTIMESLGFTTERFGVSAHDIYHKPPLANFEMHRALFNPGSNEAIYSYYLNIRDKMIRDEGTGYGYHLSPEDFYIYMTAHEYKHYAAGGTGLRSLLDTYVYLTKKGDALDWPYIAGELDKLEIAEFEAQNRALAFHLFEGEELTESDREMLDYILGSGTYGTAKNHVENEVARRGKLGYLLSRAFLPYRLMCTLYPVLKKVPVLLPFCWVHRWIHALVHEGVRKKAAFQWKTALQINQK